MITEIDFKVTGEERKKLAYAIGETLGLQLNDKDVDQVDNGEVGIVTDIELEKGYEIFVKIE